MKLLPVYTLLIIFSSCSKQENKVITPVAPVKEVTTVKISSISLQVANISSADLGSSLNGSISGTSLYLKDGAEHLIISPTLFSTSH